MLLKQQMNTYSTSQLAQIIGVHPNTIRKYEALGFISKPARKQNGYRVFTTVQVYQAQLVRAAFRVELVQNNLRKEALEIVKTTALCEFDLALELIEQRTQHLLSERKAAERAIEIASAYHCAVHTKSNPVLSLTRAEAALFLSTTIDSLRSWEMNGLLQVKRKKNGYRVYNEDDLDRLSLIRTLRLANYSLVAIKRLLDTFEPDATANIRRVLNTPEPDATADIRRVLNTPEPDEDLVSVCDRLITSLDEALLASKEMVQLVIKMKKLV